MTTREIKLNLHSLIDKIDNESFLLNLYDLLSKRTTAQDGKLWSRLSKEEIKELLVSEAESEYEENLISHAEMIKKHEKWL
ncbi:MAG: hypothetical protein JW861_08995 [Bacteroidales bacterium]|nr:hypothetical protein [Bacteroidales bacterium]